MRTLLAWTLGVQPRGNCNIGEESGQQTRVWCSKLRVHSDGENTLSPTPVELATLGPFEYCCIRHQFLRDRLYERINVGVIGGQLRILWSGGNDRNTNGAAANGQNGVETAIEPPAEPEPKQSTRLHWCQVHDVLFKRRQKSGTVWYSHKAPDGSGWCNEPEPAERR